jgi:hypothetical protein
MPMDLSRSDSQILKMSCMSDEIDVMEGQKEDGNISTEYESVINECEAENLDCEDNEALKCNRNGE